MWASIGIRCVIFVDFQILFSREARSLPSPSLLGADGSFEWGRGPILEKVIRTREDRERYEKLPRLVRSGVAIIEPWRDAGGNKMDERVRASKNIAYALQRIADADSVL